MKTSQVDTINKLYVSYNDTIGSLRLSILKEKSKYYDSVINRLYNQKDSTLYYKAEVNELTRRFKKRDEIIEKVNIYAYIHVFVLTLLVMLPIR